MIRGAVIIRTVERVNPNFFRTRARVDPLHSLLHRGLEFRAIDRLSLSPRRRDASRSASHSRS